MAPRRCKDATERANRRTRRGRLAKLTAGEARTRRQVAALVADHIELARKIAKIRAAALPPHMVFDDVFSDAMKGLWDAAKKFQPARGVKFTTFANWRIRGAIDDGLRKCDWLPRGQRAALKRRGEDPPAMMSLSMVVASDGGDAVELGDGVPATRLGPAEQRFMRKVSREQLRAICWDLAARTRLILMLYYVDGLPMAAVGHIVGLSESRVGQIHTAAIIRLRRRMTKNNQPKGHTL